MSAIRSPLLLGPTHPSFLHSERFVVLFGTPGNYRRLFSVQYERTSEGLGFYVHLPYFAHSEGVLGRVEIPAGNGPITIDFGGTSTTTSKKLKYTHHADGEAHFSQDGQVFTTVRAQTPPLNAYEGHLFTVNFWGVEGFQMAKPKDLKPPDAKVAPVEFTPQDPHLPPREQMGRIIATRYTVPVTGMEVSSAVATKGPIQKPVEFLRWDGERDHGIPIFPPEMQINDFHISLRYEPMERTPQDRNSALSLIGGFNAPIGNAGPVGAIIIIYTDRDPVEWDRLVKDRGTIDLPESFRTAKRGRQSSVTQSASAATKPPTFDPRMMKVRP